jgi:hypothetical protein
MPMTRAKISVQANVRRLNVKCAVIANGRSYNPECEACQ